VLLSELFILALGGFSHSLVFLVPPVKPVVFFLQNKKAPFNSVHAQFHESANP
jgi:hypothetical protein